MRKRILSLLLTLVMIVGLLPTVALAKNDDFTVTISMEGLTLGQGYYLEPRTYTLDRINELVKDEPWAKTFTADDLTADVVTIAMLKEANREYTNTGTVQSDFYLSRVSGIPAYSAAANSIPQIILKKSGETAEALTADPVQKEGWLGEKDYNSMSGWMFTARNSMPNVGCAKFKVQSGDVIRWQFSLYGYGADLGYDNNWGAEADPYFTAANKDELCRKYAASTDETFRANAKTVLENLTATEADIAAALEGKTPEISTKPTGIKITVPTTKQAEIGYNELENFKPEQLEYHVQTTTQKTRWMGPMTVTVDHPDEEAKVKLKITQNADGGTSTGDRTVSGSVNNAIKIMATQPMQTYLSKLTVEVASQGETTTYTIWLHSGKPYPVTNPSYTWDGGECAKANYKTDRTKKIVQIFLSADTPDDALLTVDPKLGYQIKTTWDGKVQLKDGAATVSAMAYVGNAANTTNVTFQFLRDPDVSIKSIRANDTALTNVKGTQASPAWVYQTYIEGDKLELNVVPTSEFATVTYQNGTPDENGVIVSTATVTAGDARTTRTYTVYGYPKTGSSDKLADLQLYLCRFAASSSESSNAIALDFGFDPDKTEYSIEFQRPQYYQLYAQAIAANAESKITARTVNRTGDTQTNDTVELSTGMLQIVSNLNEFDYWAKLVVTVTPTDGKPRDYTIYLKDKDLPLSAEAALSSLSYQIGTGEAISVPDFKTSKREYSVTLPYGTEQVRLLPKTSNPGAVLSGETELTLVNGTAEAVFNITSADGTVNSTYTVRFTTAEHSKYLSSLSYKVGAAEPAAAEGFNKETDAFAVILPQDTADGQELTLVGTPENPAAQVSSQPVQVSGGKAVATITVTDNELTRTYSVYFYVGAVRQENNELADLRFESEQLKSSELDQFISGKTEYTLYFMPSGTGEVTDGTITATLPEGSDAEITVHYHRNGFTSPQCVNETLQSGVPFKMTDSGTQQILKRNTHQVVTITITPSEGESKSYSLNLINGDGSVDMVDFSMHIPEIVVLDKEGKVKGTVSEGQWNMFFQDRERTFNITHGLAETGDTVRIRCNLQDYLVHPVQPYFTGILSETEDITVPMTFINQKGETGTNYYTFHLCSEVESVHTFEAISYHVGDGAEISIPMSSFRAGGKNGDDDVMVTDDIILPEGTSDSEEIQITTMRSINGSISTFTYHLDKGAVQASVTCRALSGEGTAYRINFRVASATAANAQLAMANYTVNGGEIQNVPDFASDVYSYQCLVPGLQDGDEVKLTVLPKFSNAAVTGTLSAAAENGYVYLEANVTSADGTASHTYGFEFADHFDATTQKGLTELTYSIGSETTCRSVKGFSSNGSFFTVTLPYGTPDDEIIHFYPTLGSASDAAIVGDTDIPLENGSGMLRLTLSYPHGKPKMISVMIKREGKIMSAYEYLPIGSQYTNKGFGSSPIVYDGTHKLIAPPNNWANCQTCGNFGGYMTYKLTNPLKNDPANPYGVDFIVYGNSQGGYGYGEPASIWVAQDKDNDGQPDKWYELAGSAHYDAETIWNYQVTYIKENDGSTAYETSKGESGVFPKYEYPDIDKYGSQGVAVDPVKMTLTGTLLDEKTREPLFGYGDVHANDEGGIETPMNPYRPGSDQDSFSDVHNRGDAMDISWAVDENGLPVELDEISFIKAVNASFVLHSAFGERSAEIYVIVPLYGNAGKEAVGQSAELSGITLEDAKTGAQTASLPFKSGKYVYTFEASALADQTLKLNAPDGANVIVNNAHYDEDAGYLLKNAIRIADDTTMLRIVVQEGEKEPTLYYLTIRDSSSARWTLRFDANGGLIDGEETLTHSYYSDQSGEKLPVPTRAGYTFLGWYDGETRYEALTDALASGTTLTAKWQENNDTPVPPVVPSKPSRPSKPSKPAEPDTGRKLPFTDVTSGSWYYDGVKYVCDNGLMNGTSANEFNPNANTTRSMIVTILARMEGVNTSGGATWYAHGREWAMQNGISDGTNMEGKITREQLAAMLYRYVKMKGYDVSASASLSGYTDASGVSGWAKEAMQWAVGSGLIQGSGNALTPQANASRAQIATILMRFAQNIAM